MSDKDDTEQKIDGTVTVSHSESKSDADNNLSEQQGSQTINVNLQEKSSENVNDTKKASETDNTPGTVQSTEDDNFSKSGESILSDYPRRNKKLEVYRKAISDLNCPFVWQADLHIKTYGNHDLDLLADAEDMFEETGFRFRRFIINLVLCYHNFYKRLIKESLQNLEELERMLSYSSKRECRDMLFNTINDALFHVTHSCRVYILESTQQKKQAAAVLQKIKTYDSMNDANKAGIWGVRASVYVEYGYDGVVTAVEYAKKAISLDPNNDFWYFMKGMYLGRLRRMENHFVIPDAEEFSALKKAISMREDPSYIAVTAEVYLETAKSVNKLCVEKLHGCDERSLKQLTSELNTFNIMAAKLFKKSVNLRPTSAHLLFRCGKGLMNLPPPHQDLKLAYDFLQKGLHLSPKNSYGNHAMAIFLEKYKKDPVRAKQFLTVSVNRKNFQANIDMVRLKFTETRDSEELIAELLAMLDEFTEIPKRRKLLGEIVCYYLFINFDLVEASYYMKKLVLMHSKLNDVIYNFKSGILSTGAPVPLLDIIISQMKHAFGSRDVCELEINVYKKFIDFLCEEDVVPKKVSGNLFQKLKTIIEKGFKRRETINVEKSDVHKKVNEVGDYDANLYDDTADTEYFKYYRDRRSAEKNGTVDEFFAMYKQRHETERLSGESTQYRREKGFRQNKHHEDVHDGRDRSRSPRKSKNKRGTSGESRRKSGKSAKRSPSPSRRSPSPRTSSPSANSSESESTVSADRSDSKRERDRKRNRTYEKHKYERKRRKSKSRRKNRYSDEEESSYRKTKPANEEKVVHGIEKLRIDETSPPKELLDELTFDKESLKQTNDEGDDKERESNTDVRKTSKQYADDENKLRERKKKNESDASEHSDRTVKSEKGKKRHGTSERRDKSGDDFDCDRRRRRRKDSERDSFSDCSAKTTSSKKKSKRKDSPKRKEKHRQRSKYSDGDTRSRNGNRGRSDESDSSDSSAVTVTSVVSSRSKTKRRDSSDRKYNRKQKYSKKNGKYDENVCESDKRSSSSRQQRAKSERYGRRHRKYSEGEDSTDENLTYENESDEHISASRQKKEKSGKRQRRHREHSEGDESRDGKYNRHESDERTSRSSSRPRSGKSEKRGRRHRQYSDNGSERENGKYKDSVHESDECKSSNRHQGEKSKKHDRGRYRYSESDESRSSRRIQGENSNSDV